MKNLRSDPKEPRSFTMIELMVVIVIIGSIAAFALPNYTKAVERTRAKNIMMNLTIIAQAEEEYKRNNGSYFLTGGTSNLSAINSALGTAVVPVQNVLYMCGSSFMSAPGGCIGSFTGTNGWTYGADAANGWQISCTSTQGGHPCPL